MERHTLNDPTGYYWALYKDFTEPFIVSITYETWDHTRDGDRWALWHYDEEVPPEFWFKYTFIEKIKEPEFPYSRIEVTV